MFFRNKKRALMGRAHELEAMALANPYGGLEVDPDLAEHMGAFVEEAVDPEDFYELEPGLIDAWLALDCPGDGERG
jgi:hypothetical protein